MNAPRDLPDQPAPPFRPPFSPSQRKSDALAARHRADTTGEMDAHFELDVGAREAEQPLLRAVAESIRCAPLRCLKSQRCCSMRQLAARDLRR